MEGDTHHSGWSRYGGRSKGVEEIEQSKQVAEVFGASIIKLETFMKLGEGILFLRQQKYQFYRGLLRCGRCAFCHPPTLIVASVSTITIP